ncbi:MAG: tRNA epoxyqueuosine(34) reductase QueG [Chloroflexi bacterium]|nr:tRNA epoxyqueuosine(34) reductase QueG [Chloroflexota bacterium]
MVLTEKIKDEARLLGFAMVGVTTPDPPPHWPVFQNWLAVGRHGSMGYLTDPRRADPRLVLPECKSILVLAMCYPDPESAPATGQSPLSGRVAAYAWGRDYHLVLPEKLKALAGFIEREAGASVPHRWYTDTGPLLERDLAQRAGLGWIGKNTCLINPSIGSYFFLAEILLGIEFEPDPPFTYDRCGTCTRCIEACPTACILPDRTLDARRCISYLTIENKGEIPLDLRQKIGNWVFGCDICQIVCPWNRRSKPAPDPAFVPRSGVPAPDLTIVMPLSPQEFNKKFKDSPIQRARRRSYLRNVSVALGNTKNPAAVPALEGATQEEDSLIGIHVRWALEQIRKG